MNGLLLKIIRLFKPAFRKHRFAVSIETLFSILQASLSCRAVYFGRRLDSISNFLQHLVVNLRGLPDLGQSETPRPSLSRFPISLTLNCEIFS